MAFLKFLGKSKKKEGKKELEAPPAPPAFQKQEIEPVFSNPEPVFDQAPESEPTPVFDTPKMSKAVADVPSLNAYEQSALRATKSDLAEREGLVLTGPIFILAENYQEMIDEISSASSVLKKSTEELLRLEELKAAKDKEFNKWKKLMEDMQKKLIYVDKTIFEAK